MTDDRNTTERTTGETDDKTSARRRFLGKVGKVAVTTSAVTLMLSAGTKRSVAGRYDFNEWH